PAGDRISGEVYGVYIDRGTDCEAALWSMPALSKPCTKAIETAFSRSAKGSNMKFTARVSVRRASFEGTRGRA
ncbi:MAG: hypothetical protein ACREWE_09345, partial [Gammaproteobacteria bacterium]